LIDSHTHMDMLEFDADREGVLRRARESGIAAVVTIGIDIASSEAAIALAEKHSDVFATVGIHPHDASKVTDADIARLEELAEHPRVVAVGEIGLDFYRNRSSKESQVESFKRQLEIASKLGLPVVIHSRNARDEVFEILRKYALSRRQPPVSPNLGGNDVNTGDTPISPGRRNPAPLLQVTEHDIEPIGVLHCFSGDADLGRKYIDMGFLLSFAGPVTYPKSSAANVAKEMPIDKMLTETDCPFLAPQAHRGKRNEPAYVSYVAAKIAEVKGMSPESVAEITSANAIQLFRLPIEQGVNNRS
jgi:TatD DNase family protein